MKKFAIVLALVATLAGNGAYAQTTKNKSTGNAAQAGTYSASDSMSWGVALVGLAIVGAVVGATVAGATSSQGSFSH